MTGKNVRFDLDVAELVEAVEKDLESHIPECAIELLEFCDMVVNGEKTIPRAASEFMEHKANNHAWGYDTLCRSVVCLFVRYPEDVQKAALLQITEKTKALVESRIHIRNNAPNFKECLELFTEKEKFCMLLVSAVMSLSRANIDEYAEILQEEVTLHPHLILDDVRTLAKDTGDDRLTFLCGIVDVALCCE